MPGSLCRLDFRAFQLRVVRFYRTSVRHALDSTYFVRRVVMNFPQKINLNFVDYMKIEQDFDRAEDGTRQLMNESITTEFKLVDNSDGIYAKRDVYYRNYIYEPDDDALQAFRRPEKK